MRRSIENKIRFNAIFIYVIAALLCGGLVFYVYRLGSRIEERRDELNIYYEELAGTEAFVETVNYAQREANLYITTRRTAHLRNFGRTLKGLNEGLDTMVGRTGGFTLQDSIMVEIGRLLGEKGRVVSELGAGISGMDGLDTVSIMLSSIAPEQMRDTVFVHSTTVTDTVVSVVQKKKRRRRDPDPDTMLVTKSRVDTLQLDRSTHYDIVSQASGMVERATQSYTRKIEAVERNINRLVSAEYEISSSITQLLVRLYSEVVRSSFDNMHEREAELRTLAIVAICGGLAALVIILVFLLFIINDVNKGREAREALQVANERTRSIMESRHQLLLSVSHDIKTPLNSILGYLEMGSSGRHLSGKEIGAMQSAGKHITALLENLLEFSSLEKGTVEKDEQSFVLSDLCEELIEIFLPLTSRRNLRLEHSFGFAPGLRLRADSLKIKQIIVNVMSNAVKYTSSGRVALSVDWRDGRIRCVVEDSGVGIPADQMHRLFEPFARVAQNNALAKGSGFGMYVVKGLTDLLGGSIEVDSQIGRGTRVSIEIPAAESAQADRTASRRRKIAVIDDDTPLMTLVRDMCVRLGHECTVTDSYGAARRLMKELRSYDLVITDMEMGRLSGEDILRKIRAMGCDIPVVVMTGRGDIDRPKAKAAGFDDYLAKPVSMAAMIDVIGDASQHSNKTAGNTLLSDMFDGDHEAMREIQGIFAESAQHDIEAAKGMLKRNEFPAAQALCHKVLPMFIQMGADDRLVALLKKMDAARGKTAFTYPIWKKEMAEIIRLAESFVSGLKLP